jgi:hypothetical protein
LLASGRSRASSNSTRSATGPTVLTSSLCASRHATRRAVTSPTHRPATSRCCSSERTGPPSWLNGALSEPLGIGVATHRCEGHVVVETGATIIVYTDGLVERRDEPLDEGLTRLACVAPRAISLSTDDACRLLVDELRAPDSIDDTAILLLRRRALSSTPSRDDTEPGSLRADRARHDRQPRTGRRGAGADLLARWR